MSITCFIIDDEPLAIEVLESHIEKIDRLEVAGRFQNAVKAFEELQSNPVDLLFLDIQMPGLTGIDFVKTLKHPPKIIFTTAYREYALEGYELDVVDYLLKPISFERFLQAVDKVYKRLGKDHSESKTTEETTPSHLFAKVDKKKVRIPLDEILYIESQRDYALIVTESGEIQVRQNISALEKRLRSEGFIRIHRSFIVSIKKIISWSATEIEVTGRQLPVGRTYKNEVMQKLESASEYL